MNAGGKLGEAVGYPQLFRARGLGFGPEVCPVPALKLLINAIIPSLVEISMDLHGTRVIQALVEMLGHEPTALHNEILAIGSEMSHYIFELSTHPNGNHVI